MKKDYTDNQIAFAMLKILLNRKDFTMPVLELQDALEQELDSYDEAALQLAEERGSAVMRKGPKGAWEKEFLGN